MRFEKQVWFDDSGAKHSKVVAKVLQQDGTDLSLGARGLPDELQDDESYVVAICRCLEKELARKAAEGVEPVSQEIVLS